jgi:hypothetical protein
MNRILRWYLRTFLSRPIIRAIDWTPEERSAFDLFCRTSCGIKLFEFLRQIVANTTFNAVYHKSVSAECARARGMQDLLAVLHRLRVFPALQEESNPASFVEGSEPQSPAGANSVADEWRRGFIGGRGAIG